MRWLLTLLIVSSSSACQEKETRTAASGAIPASSSAPAAVESTGSSASPGSAAVKAEAPPPDDDGASEIADLVVHAVGSKALGNQTIEASCVAVSVIPAGDWTVAAARLKGCGDKTARSIVWLYKRQGSGKWNEDYAGQPPKCWKGVPPDIARSVALATSIPTC